MIVFVAAGFSLRGPGETPVPPKKLGENDSIGRKSVGEAYGDLCLSGGPGRGLAQIQRRSACRQSYPFLEVRVMGMVAFYAGLIMGALVGVVLMALWSRVVIKEGVLKGEARAQRQCAPPS